MASRPPKLLGTYSPPPVETGDRVACLYRDCGCAVTSWSSAPISWPRVQPRGRPGRSGLWVSDTLVKAIRTESAVALRHWFGVSVGVVWRWRKAFGVGGHATTQGSRIAIRAAAVKGAAAIEAKEWTDAELDRKAEVARRLGLRPGDRWEGRGGWAAKELKLLGTGHDKVIAAKLGRTVSAVTSQRTEHEIPAFSGWPGGGPAWTEGEIALLGTGHDGVIAERIGRTPGAVCQKRLARKIPTFRDRRAWLG